MNCGTPKLTQSQFHTFKIDHNIIKQEVTTTVSVKYFLDVPSCNCCGAPTEGTVLLLSTTNTYFTVMFYLKTWKHRGLPSLNPEFIWTYTFYFIFPQKEFDFYMENTLLQLS